MKSAYAPTAYLLDPGGFGRLFAFGLNWSPLVGSQVKALAHKKARHQRATYYVAGGVRASAVGCARLPGAMRKRGVYSAAQAFAQWHSQEALICVAQVPDGRVWMAAAQDGAVIARTDVLFPSFAQAHEAASALMAQRPSLRLCDGAETLQALLNRSDDSSLLIPLRSYWSRIPLPIRGMVLALGISFGVSVLRHHVAAPVKPAKQEVSALDQASLWQQAMATFSQRYPIHTSQDLQRMFSAVHRLPLMIQGWIFRSARCQAVNSGWDCSALYSRSDLMATNADFNALVPQGWQVDFKPLNEAVLSWALSSVSVPLALPHVPDIQHVDTVLTSTLQRLQPLFSQVLLSLPEALVVAPLDEHGVSIAPPNQVPRIRRRALSLNGPLRSFSLLPDYTNTASVAWTGFSLHAEPGRKPDTAVSALTAQLQGFIYEKE